MARFSELGVTGLRQYSGYIDEERLRRLQGEQGRRTFREMSENDALIGGILKAIEGLLRNVDWRVESADDTPDRREEAEFVESLMEDMSHSWEDFISEVLSMLPFGWSAHEIVWKRREGPLQKDATRRSRYKDGRIGWRKLPVRAQDTLDRWDFDDDGGIRGLWQMPPDGGATIYIPIRKLLMFKTTSRKSNPEGISVLRNAYIAWHHKTRIQNVEAIGIERDLAGMPLIYAPQSAWDTDADSREFLNQLKNLVVNVRRDEQEGVLLPSVFDEKGNRLLDFTLIGAGSGTQRQFDTTTIIERYNKEIALSMLADVILLGHEKVGSFALADSKTELFALALGAWLKEIASVLNRHALPRLYELNGFNLEEPAKFVPGDIEKVDIEKFSIAVNNLVTAGFLTAGSEEDEDHTRELLDLPATPVDRDAFRADREEAQNPTRPAGQQQSTSETEDGE